MFVLSNFVGAEVTSMGTGIISILLSVLYVKLIGVKTPEEYHNKHIAAEHKFGAFRALSPYIYMLILLPLRAVRLPRRSSKTALHHVHLRLYPSGWTSSS